MAELQYQVDEMLFKMNALAGSSNLPEKPREYFTDSSDNTTTYIGGGRMGGGRREGGDGREGRGVEGRGGISTEGGSYQVEITLLFADEDYYY